jgi:hypothetical protein
MEDRTFVLLGEGNGEGIVGVQGMDEDGFLVPETG